MMFRARITFLVLGGLLVMSCTRSRAPEIPELLEVPQPNLSAAEPAVQEQVARQRRELEALLTADDFDPNAAAEAYSNLGLAFVLYDFTDAAERHHAKTPLELPAVLELGGQHDLITVLPRGIPAKVA